MARDKHRRTFDGVKEFLTTIGAGTSISGNFSGGDNCLVLGKVTGDFQSAGSLVISSAASWQGNIDAENVMVAGEVVGDISARKQIEILATARITGRIRCPRIAIAHGAVHQGELLSGLASHQVTHFEDRRETR